MREAVKSFFNLVPFEQIEGLYSSVWPRSYNYSDRFPGSAMLTAGGSCTGHYLAIRMWEAAVNEAGTVQRDAITRALNHARRSEGPVGPAEMVPGQHPCSHEQIFAQAQRARFRVVKTLGSIDPNERMLTGELQLGNVG
ncbi:ABC transporter substrate-binding protein [Mesorhizobium sp. Cs1299R1N3]|uniref:ABC transporter substrate-binding protein n=1 Tax=Mesorhizobium sp. Cs1299R1N3 TaxID=3015173 RepID=UPI00301D3AAD